MEEDGVLICEECDLVVEELFSKGPFNGNKDKRELCKECYEKIHKEKIDE